MASALVVEHMEREGPGSLGRWLPAAGLELRPLRLWAREPVPTRVEHDALIVMGGPADAFDDDADQPAVRQLLRDAIDRSVPVLGICLGAQLLALAAGGAVGRSPKGPERGCGLVRRADAAASDPLLRHAPFLPDVVNWHRDEVTVLPPGAVSLCRGEHTEHQAFRVGATAWGMQFHPEVDEDTVAAWAAHDGVDPAAVLPFPADVDLEATWRPVMDGFARVARGLFTGVHL